MKTRLTILLAAVFCGVLGALAQSVDAQAYYLNKEGVEEHSNTIPEVIRRHGRIVWHQRPPYT